ncbi:PilZ domain-containing protein [Sedimenticola sp.]|uniref:PilZ domain-containing protein n=1 Tax=Sedimenticola sp. TaxID=1940285 RepID=UPI003D0F95A7
MTSQEQDDRRHFQRILFDAPVVVSVDDRPFQTKLIDISLNGALMESVDGFACQPGDRVTLNIRLGDEASIDMEAQISHLEGNQVGMHCLHIDMESIGHLRRLVELNLGDPELLERELSALG